MFSVAVFPSQKIWEVIGWMVISTFSNIANVAELETTGQVAPLRTTSKVAPSSDLGGLVIVKVAVLTPLYVALFAKFRPFFCH